MTRDVDGNELKVGDLATLAEPNQQFKLSDITGVWAWAVDGTKLPISSLRRVSPPEPKRPKLPKGWSYASDVKQPLPTWGPCAWLSFFAEGREEVGRGHIASLGPGSYVPHAGDLRWLLTFTPPEVKP